MSANLIINSTTAATSVVDPLGEDGTIEWIMSKIDQFPIKLSFIFSCAMVIGSIVPYIPQYFTIKQTQNTEGFSLYVCLTLLIANILRIMFWFGKHFETPLLIQSIVMIMAMFILLELCVRVRNSNLIIKQKRRYFSEKDSMKTMLTTSKSNESNHHSKDLSTTTTINLKRSRSLDDCHNEKQYNNRNVYVKKNSITGIIYMMKNSISQTLPKNYHHPHQQQRQNDHSTIDMTTDDDNNNDNSQPKSKNHHFFKQISNLENKMKLVKNQFESNIQQRRQSSTNQNTQQQQQSSPPTTIQNDHHQCSSSNHHSNQESSNLSPKQTIVSSYHVDGNGGGGATATTTAIHSVQFDDSNLQQKQQRKNEMIIVDEMGSTKLIDPKHQLLINDDLIINENINTEKTNDDDDQFKQKRFIDFDLRFFWEWTDFMSYLECMAVFTLIAGLIFYLFIDVPLIVEGYGLVALVTESLLASPQFFRNLKVKSVEGMSKLMVFTWFLGDLYKTVYFFVRQAPFQFLLCGCTQITFDSLIFMQIICYKKATYRKIPKSKIVSKQQPRGSSLNQSNQQLSINHSKSINSSKSRYFIPSIGISMIGINNDDDHDKEEIKLHKL
ncbi:uncharacterized protein LOC113795764 isoform X2 [Dermatophagoides pteronyssinus]|uniref:uncharacterized protein LOC113795764 isoform X2 n=1 Tax=Dermatophagoides pteronyssinus TaxID=6956 RepID=UPI003F665C5E